MGEPIVISEYDPSWPELFCELRDRLPAGLRMRARSIEHIGSTAVSYAALKRELAATYGDDRAGYTEAKSAFIEAMLAGG